MAPVEVLREVLSHEIAHIAVRDLHGVGRRPHGPEWMALVRAAGFEPQKRIAWSSGSRTPNASAIQRPNYLHRCPVCQLRRIARRPVRHWRCAACVTAGLSGRLDIGPLPKPKHT